MKLKINTSADAVKDSTGMSFIGKTGIYDVTINFASLDVSKGGAESVVFNLDYNGQSQTIYGTYITDKEGNVLDIGMGLINKLGVISGLDDGDELDVEEETHKVGKDQKDQDFQVITNFSGLPCKIRIQMEYSLYNGEIQERKVIRNFFREDGASAQEIVNDSEVGKQHALELEKYSSVDSYRDELTSEQVEEWKANRSKDSSSATKATATTAASTKKASLFKK